MTPQFAANLATIHGQPLAWTFLWALAALACAVAVWRFSLIRETDPHPGSRTMVMCLGVVGFGMAGVLPAMMVVFKIWAVVHFS